MCDFSDFFTNFVNVHRICSLVAIIGSMLTDLELCRFDAIVVSSEVGFEKPAPEIFRIALGTN
jgi:hypothetical protein